MLDERGVKLFFVSIGSAERGREFAALTGFPEERLLADPDSQTYRAMGWHKSVSKTFFSIETPLSLLKRQQESGLKVLKEVLSNWKPWIPPKSDQAYQQGGTLQFHGDQLLWELKDVATGAHVRPGEILERARKM